MDANGRCIVSEDFGYENVSKSSIPAPSPLLCCYKDRGKYDYRFSSSGELFLSGDIVVKTIDRRKELYYYELAVEKNGVVYYDYYDIYGNAIYIGKLFRGFHVMSYDDERGFYYWDPDTDKDRYINKKIDDNGHVVPIHTYSSSFGGWGSFGSSDVWAGSDMDGGYEWNDYSGSSNSYSGGSTTQPNTHICGLCGGTGRVVETNGTSFGNTKWCSECGKYVPDNHYHTICPSCKGKGYW